MRILVTGGAGFIGSHYVRTLLDGGYPGLEEAQVSVLDLLTYAGNRANLPASHERMTFVHGDVCDTPLLLDLLPGHDLVVHFAAESHVDRSLENPTEFVRTNVSGTQTLLGTCLRVGVPRIVHVSTDEVYGSIAGGSWTESWPVSPNSPYAASKAGADHIALAYWRSHGVNVSIVRGSNNYGPYQYPEKFIPKFITNLLEGEPVPLYGNGDNIRDWLHVDDYCRAVDLVLRHGEAGEVYNVGGGNEYTNRAISTRLLELCDADRSMLRTVQDRNGHDLRYSLDSTKIREELGFVPQVDFDSGLAETVAWYRENPAWWKAGET